MSGVRVSVSFALAALIAGCAGHPHETQQPYDAAAALQWAANGWLSPSQTGEPEIIGLFETNAACEAAVEGWMSRQVVGNPVSGQCFPIDRH